MREGDAVHGGMVESREVFLSHWKSEEWAREGLNVVETKGYGQRSLGEKEDKRKKRRVLGVRERDI